MRRTVVKDLTHTKNQIHNWLDIYFPEYKVAYVNWESKSFITIIKQHSLPSEIVKLSPNQIYEMLPLKMRMGVGIGKIEKLVIGSKRSIGIKEGLSFAKLELKFLLDKYEGRINKIEEIYDYITKICNQLDEIKKIVQIKGIGLLTASGIVAKLGY